MESFLLISQSLISNLSFFVLGTAIGSFLNVVIDRLETNEPILTGRSHCDSCKYILQWYDLIPILSFFCLRGKCRYCGKSLRLQYPLVELATGILFVLIYIQSPPIAINRHQSLLIATNRLFFFQDRDLLASLVRLVATHAYLVFVLFLVSSLIFIFVYDLKHKIIPDKIVLPAILVSFFYTLPTHPTLLINQWLSAIGAGSFFLALIIATRGRGMGGGDVKLVFLMGLILGWPKILIALYLSFITGALVGLFLIAVGKKRFGQEIPFGPFLSASTIATLLYGETLLHLIVAASP